MVQTIKELVAKACPEYSFEFDTEKMMNVEADDRHFPCVFLEEYSDGRIEHGYGFKRFRTVELSFMRLADFQGDALDRERIREDMEMNAVLPFLRQLRLCNKFDAVTDFVLVPEPPRFDANCVSLLLRFDVAYKLC